MKNNYRIVCFGASITQGRFEYVNGAGFSYDEPCSYPARLDALLSARHPELTFEMRNAGVGGTCAAQGLERLEEAVLSKAPDLVVLDYGGWNEINKESPEEYAASLSTIVERIQASGAKIVFLTMSGLASRVIDDPEDNDFLRELKRKQVQRPRSGLPYLQQARAICRKYRLPVCDLTSYWDSMEQSGVDTTLLLSSHVTHPNRLMQDVHAHMLLPIVELTLGLV